RAAAAAGAAGAAQGHVVVEDAAGEIEGAAGQVESAAAAVAAGAARAAIARGEGPPATPTAAAAGTAGPADRLVTLQAPVGDRQAAIGEVDAAALGRAAQAAIAAVARVARMEADDLAPGSRGGDDRVSVAAVATGAAGAALGDVAGEHVVDQRQDAATRQV